MRYLEIVKFPSESFSRNLCHVPSRRRGAFTRRQGTYGATRQGEWGGGVAVFAWRSEGWGELTRVMEAERQLAVHLENGNLCSAQAGPFGCRRPVRHEEERPSGLCLPDDCHIAGLSRSGPRLRKSCCQDLLCRQWGAGQGNHHTVVWKSHSEGLVRDLSLVKVAVTETEAIKGNFYFAEGFFRNHLKKKLFFGGTGNWTQGYISMWYLAWNLTSSCLCFLNRKDYRYVPLHRASVKESKLGITCTMQS